MDRNFDKKLVLEDGSEYLGYGFGANCDAVFEIVFNTSMAGYQDIVTDPSYTDQIVCLTYPLIGNFGMASDNYETKVQRPSFKLPFNYYIKRSFRRLRNPRNRRRGHKKNYKSYP